MGLGDMMLGRFALIALALMCTMTPAIAQQFQLFGKWSCTVRSDSNAPALNYGLEVEVQINPDRTLHATGMVIYTQLRNSVQKVEGFGDWTVLPPDAQNPTELLKMRMHPPNHAIITWFARPVGVGIMYNLYEPPPQNGVVTRVETQCSKYG